MPKKTIFIIAIVTIIIIFIALLFYSLSSEKQINQTPQSTNQLINKPGITKLFEASVMAPILNSKGSDIFYFDAGGSGDLAFHAFNLVNHQISAISPKIPLPDEIIWSPTKDRAIIKITYEKNLSSTANAIFSNSNLKENTQYAWLFDFRTQKFSLIGSNIGSLIWSLDGQKITYQHNDQEKSINQIESLTLDNSNRQVFYKFDNNLDYILDRLSASKILVSEDPSDVPATSNLYTLDITNNQFEKILQANRYQKFKPVDEKTILYQDFGDQEKSIGILDLTQKKETSLNIDTDLGQTIIADDKQSLIAPIQENNIVKLDKVELPTGNINNLYTDFPKNFTLQYLIAGPDDKTFYFTDQDTFYQLKIK